MKQPEYIEGPEALRNFEQGMKALFKAPKVERVSLKKKNANPHKRATSPEPGNAAAAMFAPERDGDAREIPPLAGESAGVRDDATAGI